MDTLEQYIDRLFEQQVLYIHFDKKTSQKPSK